MTGNCATYTSNIENMILANLDGWIIETPTPTPTSTPTNSVETQTINSPEDDGISPFMTAEEIQSKANKVITRAECQLFYEETLDMAYMYTNRLNIDDLSSVESRSFIRAVCKWTASNLWNKYNIRVNNEDMEDTYVQSYGGLLYKSAIQALRPFINQRITAMNTISINADIDDEDSWMV